MNPKKVNLFQYNTISGTVVDFGSGLNNTNIILDYHNSINFYNDPEQCQEFVNPVGIIQSTGDVAAKICSDLNLNGFDDWYLPSIGELELVYTNLFSQGFGDFSGSTASNLASSSDDYSNDYRLFTIDLTSGSVVNDYKYNLVYYRAVRSF
ncbi:hypothetical protein [Psychroserpens mesophilus]|uniref:hypothetical protein n=1 Tax=Psychroserpens mesophilus TaxID=325473 RepID=UPI003D648FC7